MLIPTTHIVGHWHSLIHSKTIAEAINGRRPLPLVRMADGLANSPGGLIMPRHKIAFMLPVILLCSPAISPLKSTCRLSMAIVVDSHYAMLAMATLIPFRFVRMGLINLTALPVASKPWHQALARQWQPDQIGLISLRLWQTGAIST